MAEVKPETAEAVLEMRLSDELQRGIVAGLLIGLNGWERGVLSLAQCPFPPQRSARSKRRGLLRSMALAVG